MEKKERMYLAGEMYKQNKTMKEIAAELGVNISTVHGYITDLGLKVKKSAPMYVKIMKLHELGFNSIQIAYKLEVSRCYVMAVLRANGIGGARVSYEDGLINENTQYAKDRGANMVLEKITVDGKRYEDITPLFSPR